MRRRLTTLGLCLACLLVLPFALVSPALAADPEPSFWTPQTSGSSGSLICAAVVDASTAWVVGVTGVLHTTDGGQTWTPQNTGTTAVLSGAACVGPSRCWAVGDGGTIVATTDGGATWSPQSSTTSIRLTGVDFVDQSHGWATGDAFWWGAAGMVATTNGGLTWQQQTLPAAPPGADSYSLVAVDFVDANNGWAVGGKTGLGVVLHTTDGGTTWSVQDSTTAGQGLVHAHFVNATTGWAVGEAGVIIHTTNGGATWTRQSAPLTADLHSVYFTDADNGWAVGVGGTILHTGDGGTTWAWQASGTGDMLSGVEFADTGHGWATGEYGVLLRYDASGVLIRSLTPDHAPTGATVVIAGANLGASGTVQFGTTVATTSAWSETSITCAVPTSLGLGPADVTVTPSGGATSNAIPFTVDERVVQITASVDKTVVAYKGVVKVKGELLDAVDTPLPGQTVFLQRSTNGTTWSKLKAVTSSSTGALLASTSIVRKTYFRWSFAGDATYPAKVSPKCSATCRASLTPLAVPSVVRIGVKYTSFGYLRPQHVGGRAPITISFYRYSAGRWRPMMGGTWSGWDNVSGATRYGIWYRLGTNDAGRWRVRAMHRDADHVKTYSAWRYFVVR